MRLTVDRNEFAETISWAARTIPQKTNSPVMGGVLLEAGEDLTVSAFDYEVSTRGSIPADVRTSGRCLAGGRLLAEITRNLPAAPITLELDGSRLTLSCGPARFQFPLLDVEDYPTLPDMPLAVGYVESSAFADAVALVQYAAEATSPLPALQGVSVEASSDELVLMATDRYRLSARWMDWRSDIGGTQSVLPHVRHITDAAKALAGRGEIEIGIAEEMLGLSAGKRTVTMRSIAGQFPDVRKLVRPIELTVEFAIGELVAAIKLLTPTVADREPIRFSFKPGGATLEAGATTAGSVEVPCVYDGPQMLVAYSPRFLLDALGGIEADTVTFGFPGTDPTRYAGQPTRVNGKDSRHEQVVMPVRL